MYKRKLFFYFFIIFSAFAISVSILQYKREAQFKTAKLNNTLDNYAEIVKNYIHQNDLVSMGEFGQIDSLYAIFDRDELRITMVAPNGTVLYDSDVEHYRLMENHIERPEFKETSFAKFGTDIRVSESTGTPYYYYTKRYDNFYVRSALNYDVSVKSFLKAEKMFFFVLLSLFFVMTILLIYISDKFGNTLLKLKDFALKAAKDEDINLEVEFENNELGIISKQIVNIYNSLKNTRDTIRLEREKLIRHLYISKEGIAIFASNKGKILSNSLFIQNINFISDKPGTSPELVFAIDEFSEINQFIDKYLKEEEAFLQAELPIKSFYINKRGKYFQVSVIIFSDKTFEISINDITSKEQDKNIKQQLTSNIAHELRTPVSSIMGYLETLSSVKDLDKEKQNHFIEKAYKQSVRLSELISDISVLNRIEEGAETYDSNALSISQIVSEIIENFEPKFAEKNIITNIEIDNRLIIKGNYSLLYSIFQNLFENTTVHAGNNVAIGLKSYFEDENYYYFSYYDTGTGIPENHIGRVFERFYRVDKGRRRKSGGTGLGLAIIKNAVIFHKGDISVKNREEGGVEFFFSLKKDPSN